jgi:hypothetical protein
LRRSAIDTRMTKTVGEFGVGPNPEAKIVGKIILDEMVERTAISPLENLTASGWRAARLRLAPRASVKILGLI